MTSWRKMLLNAYNLTPDDLTYLKIGQNPDSRWDDDVERYPTEDEFWDKEFDSGYGLNEGVPFYALTKDHVYFPVNYDGSEWISRVPRNPCDDYDPHHKGGG